MGFQNVVLSRQENLHGKKMQNKLLNTIQISSDLTDNKKKIV